MSQYRKKPVVIEAVRYQPPTNCREVWAFMGWSYSDSERCGCDATTPVYIKTLEGVMAANPGDWIIRGVKGEFYPCKPDVFEASYELADNPPINTDYQEHSDGARWRWPPPGWPLPWPR
jgi:hypothetical protein